MPSLSPTTDDCVRPRPHVLDATLGAEAWIKGPSRGPRIGHATRTLQAQRTGADARPTDPTDTRVAGTRRFRDRFLTVEGSRLNKGYWSWLTRWIIDTYVFHESPNRINEAFENAARPSCGA